MGPLKKDDKGFSLIEILVVILVIAIITAIAIPLYSMMTVMSKESATESEMMNIAKALEIYASDNLAYPLPGEYPDALEDNDYMERVPILDAWDNIYDYDSNGTDYTITSRGIDGIGGNSDDISVSNGKLVLKGAYAN